MAAPLGHRVPRHFLKVDSFATCQLHKWKITSQSSPATIGDVWHHIFSKKRTPRTTAPRSSARTVVVRKHGRPKDGSVSRWPWWVAKAVCCGCWASFERGTSPHTALALSSCCIQHKDIYWTPLEYVYLYFFILGGADLTRHRALHTLHTTRPNTKHATIQRDPCQRGLNARLPSLRGVGCPHSPQCSPTCSKLARGPQSLQRDGSSQRSPFSWS